MLAQQTLSWAETRPPWQENAKVICLDIDEAEHKAENQAALKSKGCEECLASGNYTMLCDSMMARLQIPGHHCVFQYKFFDGTGSRPRLGDGIRQSLNRMSKNRVLLDFNAASASSRGQVWLRVSHRQAIRASFKRLRQGCEVASSIFRTV